MELGWWHDWHLAWKIGATSLVNVTFRSVLSEHRTPQRDYRAGGEHSLCDTPLATYHDLSS